MTARLAPCLDADGDRLMLESKLAKLSDLLEKRDDGYGHIQSASDAGALVLPSTSALGRDVISQNLSELRQSWEDTVGRMNDTQTRLKAALMRWEDHEGATRRLALWLNDKEAEFKSEAILQSTLGEKRSQLERVKVNFFLHLVNILFH